MLLPLVVFGSCGFPPGQRTRTELAVNAGMTRQARTAVWTAWDDPLPPPQSHRCHWHHVKQFNASMCLMKDDRVSRELSKGDRSIASWHCNTLVALWEKNPLRGKVFLDVGGNIGHCTLTMLMQTDAFVVVVEPSPANLYYMTSTLRRNADTRHDLRKRVLVLPFAAGNSSFQATLYAAYQNAGNSVVGTNSHLVKDHDGQQMDEQYTIETRALDELMNASRERRLLKLDVQGYECRALQGMTKMMASVHTIKVEAADRWLRGHGCSSNQLLDILSSFGFLVNMQQPPKCIYQRYGCDVVVHRSSLPTCSWTTLMDARECVPTS